MAKLIFSVMMIAILNLMTTVSSYKLYYKEEVASVCPIGFKSHENVILPKNINKNTITLLMNIQSVTRFRIP